MGKYSLHFEPFRFWVQQVLPQVYEDSLSYYELLSKVIAQLNDVMEKTEIAFNSLADDTEQFETNMTNKYNELMAVWKQLQEWVTNYFNNLDVQEEINNKLDAMAADGSLSVLLKPLVAVEVAEWLNTNLEPTSPPVDKTLSIENAAADSKVVGTFIMRAKDSTPYIIDNTIDLNNLTIQGHYIIDVSRTIVNGPTNFTPSLIKVEKYTESTLNRFIIQTAYNITGDMQSYSRLLTASEWKPWVENTIYSSTAKLMTQKLIQPYISNNTIDLNDVLSQGFYTIDTSRTIVNGPSNFTCTFLKVEAYDINKTRFIFQTVYDASGSQQSFSRFLSSNGVWKTWVENVIYNSTAKLMTQKLIQPYISNNTIDLNDVLSQGFYTIDTSRKIVNGPSNFTCTFLKVEAYDINKTRFIFQTVYDASGSQQSFSRFLSSNGVWKTWVENVIYNSTAKLMTPKLIQPYISNNTIDLNDVLSQGFYAIDTSRTIVNGPSNFTCTFLKVEAYDINKTRFIFQTVYDASGSQQSFSRFLSSNGVWKTWVENVGPMNVTNNYTNIINNNTYDITSTPSITTDTNNYLASSNNNDDRTADIVTLLQSTGCCILGPGNFVIENLNMPSNSIIKGQGRNTTLQIKNNNSYGIKLNNFCSVNDIGIMGLNYTTSEGSVRDNAGIIFEGVDNEGTISSAPIACTLSNLYISNIQGSGIRLKNTGYNYQNSLQLCNAYIRNCDAGVNIERLSEYSLITNIHCNLCYYGLILNGGNNKICNSDFSGNVIGVLMDNTTEQSPNNAHGSIIGCSINHSENNSGIAIKATNQTSAFTISNCNIFYGTIDISNCPGFIISNCCIRGDGLKIVNSGNVILSNNIFTLVPPKDFTGTNIKAMNNWLKNGDQPF